ncbi:MAG: YbhB/YbcL family Raf kinase inhibitor-like protein [Thermoproteus sp.]
MGLPKRPSTLAAVALIAVAASVALAILALYHVRPAAVEGGGAVGAAAAIRVYSPAYGNGSTIPAQYTCDGADISPPLAWSGVPQGAKSLLVEMVDPDAPGGEFIHWVIYNISPNSTGLPQGVPPAAATAYGLQAVNDFGEVGYGGPCPPPGRPHRYIVLVLALNTTLEVPPGAPARQVLRAAGPYVVGLGSLVGLYGR